MESVFRSLYNCAPTHIARAEEEQQQQKKRLRSKTLKQRSIPDDLRRSHLAVISFNLEAQVKKQLCWSTDLSS